jgi:hypothetical protein
MEKMPGLPTDFIRIPNLEAKVTYPGARDKW